MKQRFQKNCSLFFVKRESDPHLSAEFPHFENVDVVGIPGILKTLFSAGAGVEQAQDFAILHSSFQGVSDFADGYFSFCAVVEGVK